VISFDPGGGMDHPLGPRYNSMGRAVAPFGYCQLRKEIVTYRLVGGSGVFTLPALLGTSSSSESEYSTKPIGLYNA
jgi:hypothetical protein